MPTITQLEYIIAVDTYRHFGEAAQQCYVTQPTLSMQIKKAEEELGVMIFDRSKQPVIPTDVGAALISQARIILRETNKLKEIVDSFQNEVSGGLRIGIIPTLAPYLLPIFVGKFIRKYPNIKLQVKELYTEEILSALKNDTLDVGILVTPLQEQSIRYIPLFYEEIKIYIHPEHHFHQDYKNFVPSEALEGTDLWMLNEGHCFRNQMINLCQFRQDQPLKALLPFEYESGSIEALKRLVDKEGGFTLLPELALPEEDESIKSIGPSTPLREVSLAYVRNFAKIRLLELLKEEIIASLPKEMLNDQRGQVVEWQ
jgi:LysR family hydrogen peroxide-inducible transcriptional activator